MSINFNPGPKILAMLDRDEWFISHPFGDWTTAVVGTGSTTKGIRRAAVLSGTTAAGTAVIRTANNMGWHANAGKSIIRWSKKIVFHAFFSVPASTANGVSRLTFGKIAADGVGALADKGIGIQIEDDVLKGIVHDGTSGATVDLSTTLTGNTVYRITIVSDGAGSTEWLLNGVSKGASSGGPTGSSGSNKHIVQIETDNGVDNASQNMDMYSLKIFLEQ